MRVKKEDRTAFIENEPSAVVDSMHYMHDGDDIDKKQQSQHYITLRYVTLSFVGEQDISASYECVCVWS